MNNLKGRQKLICLLYLLYIATHCIMYKNNVERKEELARNSKTVSAKSKIEDYYNSDKVMAFSASRKVI